jgi:phage tail sheath protein FI
LGLIQAQSGIEAFKPIMNETNNTQADIDANRLNGRIAVVPTRAIEYIAMDFVITQSGITFV